MEHDPLVVTLKQKAKSSVAETAHVPAVRRVRWPVRIAAFLVAVVACAALGYYGYLYVARSESETRTTPEAADAQVTDTIARVSELIMLPEGEEPTIATVTDPDRLKDQEFFKNAKVGDRVLLYTKARKAFLYDPVAHRLVEVAPITTELQ